MPFNKSWHEYNESLIERGLMASGLKMETPDQISFTIKNALEMQDHVIIGVEVDYRDNHRLMEILHPGQIFA